MAKQSAEVQQFLQSVTDLCKLWGMSIGHEDTAGAFTVETYNQQNEEWLLEAFDETPSGKLLNNA